MVNLALKYFIISFYDKNDITHLSPGPDTKI